MTPMTPKEYSQAIDSIAKAFRGYKTFFLTGHLKPDGDTVASELACASLLRRLGKSVDIYNYESVPESLYFLPGANKIKTSKSLRKKYDVAVIFECNDTARMGDIIDVKKQARVVINVDHHLKHSFFGHINLINVDASSNSEQLFYVFERMKMTITRDEAACLYTGIMADTGRFQHSNTNAETLRIASKLLEKDIQPALLCEKMYGTRNLSALRLLGLTLTNFELVEKNRIAVFKLTRQDFLSVGSNEEECEEIVNYGLNVPTALMSILFRESMDNGSVKISFRARRHVNVCTLAEKFGGGGHKYASGCRLKGPIDHVVKNVLTHARKSL